MPTPEIVGYASRTGSGSLSLTSLSGGIGSEPAEGDLVMLALCSRATSNVNISTPSGYTRYVQRVQPPLRFALYFKLQGSSPDTSITIPSATDVLATACAVRNVDPDEFFAWDWWLGETPNFNTVQGTGFIPDPGSITTLYDNSLVLIPTARATTESTTTAPIGYTSLSKNISSKDWICIAAKVIATAGTEDPGVWQNATDIAGVAFGSFTLALKAKSGGNIKVWNGSAWVAKPVKVWNGSAWVKKPVKRWNGSAWITTPY